MGGGGTVWTLGTSSIILTQFRLFMLDGNNLASKCLITFRFPLVPMMIIREVDMLAMQIPMQDSQNGKDKGKEQVEERKCEGKQWSDWSPCSKKCGDGFQSRWRYLPGATRGEQQSRPCHLADCPPQEYQPQMYDYVNTSL